MAARDPVGGVDLDELRMRPRPDHRDRTVNLGKGERSEGFALLAAHDIGIGPAVGAIGCGGADAGDEEDRPIGDLGEVAGLAGLSKLVEPCGGDDVGHGSQADFRGEHAGRDDRVGPHSATGGENLANGVAHGDGERPRAGRRGQYRVSDTDGTTRRGHNPPLVEQTGSRVGRAPVERHDPGDGFGSHFFLAFKSRQRHPGTWVVQLFPSRSGRV